MLIMTKVSRTLEAITVTATYTQGPRSKWCRTTYSATMDGVSRVYDYDGDAGPRLNHSAAMRRLAETLMGKALAYDGEWVGTMIDGTTCAWTRKPYTIS